MATIRVTRLALLAALVLSTVACDQATKHVARQALEPGSHHDLLGGLVQFTLAENSGGFLSLGQALPLSLRLLVFTVATAFFIVAVFITLLRSLSAPTGLYHAGLALLAAGGLGNLVDRLLRGGLVTDFCILRIGSLHTGIFNLADVALLVGVALAIASHFSRSPAPA